MSFQFVISLQCTISLLVWTLSGFLSLLLTPATGRIFRLALVRARLLATPGLELRDEGAEMKHDRVPGWKLRVHGTAVVIFDLHARSTPHENLFAHLKVQQRGL